MAKHKLKYCTKYKVYKDYIFEEIDHKLFGTIRSAIINGERYYSSTDIAKACGYRSPSAKAYKGMHHFDEDTHEYIIYIKGNTKTRLRVVSAEDAILIVASMRTDAGQKLLKWLLRKLREDDWNKYQSE